MWENAKSGPEAFDLRGKSALVVGAGTGSGRAIALALAEAGADMALSSVTQEGGEVMAIRRVAKEVAALGCKAVSQAVDATLGTGVQVMVRQVVKEMGSIDILVNCPDLFLGKPADKISDTEWSRVLSVNLNSVFFACRAAGREMLKKGSGRVINVASGLGERGLANSAAYCAAKAGVMNLTRALAQEWGPHGITVNGIGPAWMEDTPGLGDPNPEVNRLIRFIPMKRPGRTDELGLLAVYLASDSSGYVNGQTFFVDGGLLCHL